jgi:BirA family biotin operon repressor/biotin-[acetyl-CoA-carboxylase] ligase
MRASQLPADLAAALERARPEFEGYPLRLHYYEEVGSTNDVASEMAWAGAPEGTTVVADRQTAGRGRRGRRWHSPAGAGIYLSLVLRPGGPAAPAAEADTTLVTLMAGAAAGEAVERATGLVTSVKWPNDLVVEREADAASGIRRLKLAGILAEASATGVAVQHVVLGIGINVRAAAAPPELAGRVTSIEEETGLAVDTPRLIALLLVALARGRRDLLEGRAAGVLARWRQYAGASRGRSIEWETSEGRRSGTTLDVDDDGALLVQTSRGRERIVAGEVTWV